MTRRRILCRTFMLVLMAAAVYVVGAGVGAGIISEYNGQTVTITGPQLNPIIWDASNFEGFNYGLNSLSTETLTIAQYTLHGPNTDRTIDAGNLAYSSAAHVKQFEWNQFGNYLVMGFMAEPYFVGYIDENENGTNFGDNTRSSPDYLGIINLLSGGNISKVLIDSDVKFTISTGNGLKLKEGYVLKVQQVDLEGNKALLELTKNGKVVDIKVVSPSLTGTGDDIYIYELDLGNKDDVPVIVARVDDVFRGTETNVVTIEGIFQISDNITHVETGDAYGAMEVTSVDTTSITMENRHDSIILERNSAQPIIGNITFQVADNAAINFYPSVEITTDSVDNSPMYTDYCCVWDLSEGYVFAFSQVDMDGRKALFFLLKDGTIVDQEILAEEFSTDVHSDFHYRYIINGTEIINATLKSVFRGDNSSIAELVDVYQHSEIDGSVLLASGSHMFKPAISSSIPWELQDGYTLAIKDISLIGDEAWFELSKNGVVVKDEILNEAFANTSSYTSGMGSISYSLDSVLRGVHESVVIIKNIQQYSDASGNLLLSNDIHFYKTGDPVGISWELSGGYVLTMKYIDISNTPYSRMESEKVWFELSRDGIILAQDVIWSGDRFTYVNGLESFDCVVTALMHGTLTDVVKINNVNLYSDSGVQLVQNNSHTYVTANPSGDIWELFEGYSLDPKDVSVSGNTVWLSLIKDGNAVKDEIINAPEWFNYYNSTGALVFSTYVDTVFRGTEINLVALENTEQYSEINGSLIFQNLKITLSAGISLDSTIPSISINSPPDGSTVNISTLTVSGTASDDTAVASVTVNGIPATGTTIWSADITLTEDANTITVVATDTSGNIATKTITITYTPDGGRGDFNGNGRVDIGDVAKVAFMVAGKVPVDMNADFNNNGRVDIGDAAKIAFYLAGKVSEL